MIAAGDVNNQEILLPRAEGAHPDLPTLLTQAGALVEELTLYLSAPAADPTADVLTTISRGNIDVVTFTSSSTVKNLREILNGDFSDLKSATIACIGPTTASTAEQLGLEPDVVATDHSVTGLVGSLRAYLWERRTDANRTEATS